MVRIKIQVDDAALKRELGKLMHNLDNFKQALSEIAQEVEDVIENAFQSERSSDGIVWPALSPVTINRFGRPNKKLKRTGELKRSIKVTAKKREIIIEVRSPYAAPHQFGFPGNKAWGRGRAPIPARPFIPLTRFNNLTPDMIKKIVSILEEHFDLD